MSNIETGLLLAANVMEDRLFNIDFQLLADATLTLIAVIALFFFASYFFFNPAREFLQKRQDKIKEELAATSRCMPFEQENLSDVCVCCGKPAKKMVYWGRAY